MQIEVPALLNSVPLAVSLSSSWPSIASAYACRVVRILDSYWGMPQNSREKSNLTGFSENISWILIGVRVPERIQSSTHSKTVGTANYTESNGNENLLNEEYVR